MNGINFIIKWEIHKTRRERIKPISMLNSVLWSKNIVNKTKPFSFKSLVESVVLYDAQTWTTGSHQSGKLLAIEMLQSN